MPSPLIRFAIFAGAFLAGQLSLKSQAVPRAVPVASPSPYNIQPSSQPLDRMQVVDPDKKLSAGDMVTVEIVEDREGGFPRMVTSAGAIEVPPLGRVAVAGKTTTEAAADIKRRLESDYYYLATVKLNIDRVNSGGRVGTVTLSGEVRMVGPQEMIANEPLRLSSAILKAGGFTEWANRKRVKVTRQVNGSPQTTEYNVKEILEKGNENTDPLLQHGDRIFVSKSPFRF